MRSRLGPTDRMAEITNAYGIKTDMAYGNKIVRDMEIKLWPRKTRVESIRYVYAFAIRQRHIQRCLLRLFYYCLRFFWCCCPSSSTTVAAIAAVVDTNTMNCCLLLLGYGSLFMWNLRRHISVFEILCSTYSVRSGSFFFYIYRWTIIYSFFCYFTITACYGDE